MKMSKTLTQMLSLLLCLAMLVSMAPMTKLITTATATAPANGAMDRGEHTHENATTVSSATEGIDALLTAGGKFVLESDITLSRTITPTADLEICLNGKTIHASTAMFSVGGVTLTICDCSEGETGKLLVSNQTAVSNGAGIISITANGTFNLYGGTLTGSTGIATGGGAVRIDGNASSTFNMYGGVITGNSTKTGNTVYAGGGVYVRRGTFNVYGGVISGNSAVTGNDVAVGGHASIAASIHISGNAVIGSVVFITTGLAPAGTIGCLTVGTNVTSTGKLSYANTDSTVTETEVAGGWQYTFTDPHPDWTHINSETENVEALLAAGGNFVLESDVTLTSTVTPAADLRICLNSRSIISSKTMFVVGNVTLTISDCSCREPGKLRIKNQTASTNGAGIVSIIAGGTFNLYNGILTGSSAMATGGGAVRVDGNAFSVFNMYGGTITGNSTKTGNAAYAGGAVYVRRGTFNMSGGTIVGNSAVTGNGIAVGGHASVAGNLNISGNAVVDAVTLITTGTAPTATIGYLTTGTNITSASRLSYASTDSTVTETEVAGGWQYTFTDPHPDWTHVNSQTENIDALLAAGGNFMLDSDITLAGTVTPTADVHICLNGNTINASTTMFVVGNVSLTISDCSCREPGKLQVSQQTASTNGAGIVSITAGGIFNLHAGTLTGSNAVATGGGAVRIDGNASSVFNMYGGTITGNSTKTGNTAYAGGAVYVRRGTFNMYGGAISGNTAATGDGIAVGGHTSVAGVLNISGNAVVDAVTMITTGIAPTATIGNLTPGARIISDSALTALDNTVLSAQANGKHVYSYGSASSQPWTFFTEDFENYFVGDDSFYAAVSSPEGAGYPYWSGVSTYHGSVAGGSYSQYSVRDASGNKYLELKSVNGTRNYLLTQNGVSGPYTLKMDFQLVKADNTSDPTFTIGTFHGSELGNNVTAYFAEDGAWIRNAIDGQTYYAVRENASKLIPEFGKWYSMEYGFNDGMITLTVWETADPTVKGTVTVLVPEINADVLANTNTVRIQNTGAAGRNDVVLIDNFSMTRDVTLGMQEFVAVVPGDIMNVLPYGDDTTKWPAPAYMYELENPELGYINSRGQLVVGYASADDTTAAEGQTVLTLKLLDAHGNETQASFTTDLIVGYSNGVHIGENKVVGESAIGSAEILSAVVDSAVSAQIPNYTIRWSSSDNSVVTVNGGALTYVGIGSAKVTATILDATGNATRYYGAVKVQVGEEPLKVLSIGNNSSRDSLMYLSQLAYHAGLRMDVSYLSGGMDTIHDHAYNLAYNAGYYSLYRSNAYNGEMLFVSDGQTLAGVVESQDWDIIVVQQDANLQGIRGDYNSDLEYLVDYLEATQPNAKLYWNMTWALEDGLSTGTYGSEFAKYYDSDQKLMYNALVAMLDEFIVGEDALFSSENENNLGTGIGWGFDGYFANGTAIQNLRQAIDHDKGLTRDGAGLSLDVGRLTTGLTVLKTIHDDLALSGENDALDLSAELTAAEIGQIVITTKEDYRYGKNSAAADNVIATDASAYLYSDGDLPKIIAAVNEAVAVAGVPAKLDVSAQVRPEDVDDEVQSSVQVEAPQLLHFPDITTLESGVMLSAAYENTAHYPAYYSATNNTPYSTMREGVGRILLYESVDGGYNWNAHNPVLVINELQLQDWGIIAPYNRYERIGVGKGINYTTMADVRDPNLATTYVDFDNDGDVEQVTIVTFWIRYYDAAGAQHIANNLWMVTGVRNDDGSYTWAAPKLVTGAQMKRGDIASFSDGEILVPTYGPGQYGILMSWDAVNQTWNEEGRYDVPNLAPEESTSFNEISFVAPNPDSDIVYAFCRDNGTVLKSMNRGQTWELIGNEPGLIHQPGFAILDENTVFVTWARTSYPRDIYGKVFHVNGDWSDTQSQLIYASANRYAGNDTGDPSCAVNGDGDVVVISYDNSYRAIVYSIVDPYTAAG